MKINRLQTANIGSTLLIFSLCIFACSPSCGIELMEAVRLTLKYDPNIKLQQLAVEVHRGAHRDSYGQFDWTLGSSLSRGRARTPLTAANQDLYQTTEIISDDVTLAGGISKLLRGGQMLSLSSQITQNEDGTIYGDNSDPSVPVNTSTITFSITQPLLKGRGTAVTAAGETASNLEYEAAQFALRHTMSQRVLTTVQSYWNYVYALSAIDILRGSEERAKGLVQKTKKLIEGDEIPAAELNQLMANLEYKTASRISGEQMLFEAKQSLCLNMGLSIEQSSSVSSPEDTFKNIKIEKMPSLSDAGDYIDTAVDKRSDYLAYEKREESAFVMTAYYKNNTLPQLDVKLSLGSSGLAEGRGGAFFDSIDENVSGRDYSGLIIFSYPVGNNSAKGRLIQQEALYEQSRVNTKNLARSIAFGITTGLSSLSKSAEELEKTEEAHRYYEISLRQEKEKYTLGTATLLDIVTYEERLTNAMLSVLSAKRNLANVIAQLRCETGTLIDFEEGSNKSMIAKNNLVTIPEINRSINSKH